MPFNYYARLSARNQRIYDASDQVKALDLPAACDLWPCVGALRNALEADRPPAVQAACQMLADGLCMQLALPRAAIRVLAKRPSNRYGELHGLYEGVEGRLKVAQITLWMRTARRRQVVAFRSFLRTLLHELGHHLDYTYLKLPDSFHTQGFYQRESSLFHQLVKGAPQETFSASRGEPVK